MLRDTHVWLLFASLDSTKAFSKDTADRTEPRAKDTHIEPLLSVQCAQLPERAAGGATPHAVYSKLKTTSVLSPLAFHCLAMSGVGLPPGATAPS